jgi:hypothetical protein
MNLRDLPNLSKLDKRVIESIGETPFELLLDEFGDPAWPAVTRVCGAIGWNPSDYYDRHEVTLSLRAIRKKIAERQNVARKRGIGNRLKVGYAPETGPMGLQAVSCLMELMFLVAVGSPILF